MFLIYALVKKCVEMCVSVFKMLKKLFEMGYQTGPWYQANPMPFLFNLSLSLMHWLVYIQAGVENIQAPYASIHDYESFSDGKSSSILLILWGCGLWSMNLDPCLCLCYTFFFFLCIYNLINFYNYTSLPTITKYWVSQPSDQNTE